MKLALHRSIIFWSGLLVMGFVYWVWWDSISYVSEAASSRVIAINGAGGISLRIVDKEPPRITRELSEQFLGRFGEFPRPFILTQEAAWEKCHGDPFGFYGDGSTLRDYMEGSVIAYGEPGEWMIFIPHWLILLAVAALWLGLLFWRARWRRRANHSLSGDDKELCN